MYEGTELTVSQGHQPQILDLYIYIYVYLYTIELHTLDSLKAMAIYRWFWFVKATDRIPLLFLFFGF